MISPPTLPVPEKDRGWRRTFWQTGMDPNATPNTALDTAASSRLNSAEVPELLTMQMSPEVLLVNACVRLHGLADARAVLAAVQRLRERVRAAQPAAKQVYVQPV